MRTIEEHDYGDPWDAGDVRALLRHVENGRPYAWIAERIGRSVGAVRSKLYRLRKR